MDHKPLLFTLIAAGGLLVATSVQAATIFLPNNTSPKSLLPNEADAAALVGSGSGSDRTLNLSADDGGGTIKLTTVDVSGGETLGMDSDSMGHGNDKWGANQNWTFKFDQTISFDALTMKTIDERMTLKSTAWATDATASGTGWSFLSDGTEGKFTIIGASGPGTRDFTRAMFSDVAAGTEISFGHFRSVFGGQELESFTISPSDIAVPEPASFALLAGCFGLASTMVRRR